MISWRRWGGSGIPLNFPAVMGIVTIYSIVHMAIRRMAGQSLSMDDAKTNLFTQVWQWGYQPDNPPLFEWLIILLKPVVGGGFWAFLVLKYLCLMAAAAFLYRTVRRMADDRAAFITTIGAVLLYQIGWNFHQAFTHSALLVPAVCAGMWALVRTIQNPSWGAYAIFGGVVGISLLTKYNVALFWGGAVVACLLVGEGRRLFLTPKAFLVPIVAGLIIAPHVTWFFDQREVYHASVIAKIGVSEASHIARVASGMGSLLVAAISFFLPFLFVYGWACRGQRPRFYDLELLFVVAGAAALALLALAVGVFGVDDISERYLIPVLLPAYVGIVVSLLNERSAVGAVFLKASAALATLVVVVRVLTYSMPGPPFCEDCREFVPYAALQEPIAAMIPDGAILVVREQNTAGNIVEMFPLSPVREFTTMRLTNPVHTDGLPCYLIWSKDMIDPDLPLDPPIAYMENDPSTVLVMAKWEHFLRGENWRTTTWGITPVEKDNLYKVFCTSGY